MCVLRMERKQKHRERLDVLTEDAMPIATRLRAEDHIYSAYWIGLRKILVFYNSRMLREQQLLKLIGKIRQDIKQQKN